MYIYIYTCIYIHTYIHTYIHIISYHIISYHIISYHIIYIWHIFCAYGMMNQQFPEPGAEALDLGHVGFSSFLHGFAHLGLAFSVLGTTKSEAESYQSQEVSMESRRKSPFCVVKSSKILLDIFKYSMFNNFHGHFVSTEDVPTFKIHATLPQLVCCCRNMWTTSIFIADQCDHHFPSFSHTIIIFHCFLDIFPIWAWVNTYRYIFSGLFTSINPSYFDVNRRGTRVLTHSHMGLSENSVPLHPMVNDHYPY